ncbi:MAG: ferrous iron transporter B [Candidatus Kryptonium sp.]|nr:ferrous iron transporter B [Candidatus Kryptonium sp.]
MYTHQRAEIELEKGLKKLVLVGNPNVGKSIFFNYFTGLYVEVSNYPGTTVEILKGRYKNFIVYDTPGIYGLSSFNDEERIAKNMIMEADVILNIVDAVNLERDLFLTLQLIDTGKPVVVALNMMDEAEKKKIKINIERLSKLLGVPVIPTIAVKQQGFKEVADAIEKATIGNRDKKIQEKISTISKKFKVSEIESLLIIEGDSETIDKLKSKFDGEIYNFDEREKIYIERRNKANQIVAEVVSIDTAGGKVSGLIGRLAIHPIFGLFFIAIVLYLAYLVVGKLIAQDLVSFTENEIGSRIYEYNIRKFVANYFPVEINVNVLDENEEIVEVKNFVFEHGLKNSPNTLNELQNFVRDKNVEYEFNFKSPVLTILFGEFGVLTMTVKYLLFLLLPLVIGFYLMLAILEDSGYLPRLATFVDRLMNYVGLNGKAVIPMILGFGCVTMATITTRLLSTSREKRIMTAILQITIPCSAQLAVITALLMRAGFQATLIYLLTMFSVFVTVGVVLNKVLPGSATPLLIDLPPMRIPRIDNLARKTWMRTFYFIKEAGMWFFIGAFLIGVMQVTGLLEKWIQVLSPLTINWLQLPAEASRAFIMGIVRRDFGAAGFYALDLTPMQTVAGLVTITLFVPCIASLMVMLKERGAFEGLIIWASSWIIAFTVGGIVSQILI